MLLSGVLFGTPCGSRLLSNDERRWAWFWRPDSPAVTGMLRVEREDRPRTTYSEHFTVVVVYEGAFDGWYGGRERTLLAGSLKDADQPTYGARHHWRPSLCQWQAEAFGSVRQVRRHERVVVRSIV